jgi:predicted PurR-regulated permease PerM
VHDVDLDPRSVVWVMAAFIGLLALTGLVRSTPRTTTALIIALIIALALNPVVAAVQRQAHVRRSVAVFMVIIGFFVAVAATMVLLVPPAIHQARNLQSQLPDVIHNLDDLPVVGSRLAKTNAPAKIEAAIRDLPHRLSGDTTPLKRAGKSLADGLLAAFVTLLLSITLLLDGARLLRGLRRLVPESHRQQVDDAADVAYRVVGRYVAGSLLLAVGGGLLILIAGLSLGVPLAPLAAVWEAMWEMVPQIGGAVGGIPFVLLGLTQGAGVGAICAVVVILHLQLKNHVIGPVVVGQAVKLSPAASMVAALVGVSAAGVVGALVAIPLVGAVKAIYLELGLRT